MTVLPFAPIRPRPEPTIRVLWNAIRVAKKHHTLDCGCRIKPGWTYHAAGALVNGRLSYNKRHVVGCLELIQ
jgi:hypothetical protein